MPLEEEIKLTLPDHLSPDALLEDGDIRRHARDAVPVTHLYLSTYYDTQARHLLFQRLAFRLRRKGSHWMAALKGGGAVVNGLSRRMEWEMSIPGPVGDFHHLPAGELLEQLRPILPTPAPMAPLMTTEVRRVALPLELENQCRAELALDLGRVGVANSEAPIRELELELLSGPMEPMLRLADHLAQRHGLRPATGSKFTLGLQLLGLAPELARRGIHL